MNPMQVKKKKEKSTTSINTARNFTCACEVKILV